MYNCDCLEYMRSLPDKTFDLAIADPPYGDAAVNEGVSPPLHILRKRQKYNRFGGQFDVYKVSVQDRGNLGGKVLKKKHRLGRSTPAGILR